MDLEAGTSPLEQLPRELRDAIYGLALAQDSEIVLRMPLCLRGDSRSCEFFRESLALTHVSKRIRSEALPAFFAANDFMFSIRKYYGDKETGYDATQTRVVGAFRWMRDWLLEIPPHHRDEMRSLSIDIGTWCLDPWEYTLPMLWLPLRGRMGESVREAVNALSISLKRVHFSVDIVATSNRHTTRLTLCDHGEKTCFAHLDTVSDDEAARELVDGVVRLSIPMRIGFDRLSRVKDIINQKKAEIAAHPPHDGCYVGYGQRRIQADLDKARDYMLEIMERWDEHLNG